MADLRTVVLVLSVKAADALELKLEDKPTDESLVEKVRDELRAQRGDLAPNEAKQLAERMAKAGLDAVAA